MANFMRKNELIELIEKGLHYRVDEEVNAMVEQGMSAEEIAMGFFEGTVDMDLDELQRGINEAIEKEKHEEAMRRLHYGEEYKGYYSKNDGKTIDVILVKQMRDCVGVCYKKNDKGGYTYFPMYGNDERFQKLLDEGFVRDELAKEVGTFEVSDLDGFSQEDAKDIMMDAIALGVMQPRYCMIAPYTHGFELNYNGRTYSANIDPFQMPEYIVGNMLRGKKDMYSGIHFDKLKEEVEKARENLKETYIRYETTPEYQRHQRNRWDRGMIANYKYIREGYGLDGIIAGQCEGDYSSMTPNNQNAWMEAAVALNGYCLDYLVAHHVPGKEQILDYHKSRGLDLRDPEVLEEWKLSHKGMCFDKQLKMQFDRENSIKEKIKEVKGNIKSVEKGLEDIVTIQEALRGFDEADIDRTDFEQVKAYLEEILPYNEEKQRHEKDGCYFDYYVSPEENDDWFVITVAGPNDNYILLEGNKVEDVYATVKDSCYRVYEDDDGEHFYEYDTGSQQTFEGELQKLNDELMKCQNELFDLEKKDYELYDFKMNELKLETEVYKGVLNDIKEVEDLFKDIINGKETISYDELLKNVKEKISQDITDEDYYDESDYLIDFNYKHLTGTIYYDIASDKVVLSPGFEVWDDADLYGCFNKDDIQERINKENLIEGYNQKKEKALERMSQNLGLDRETILEKLNTKEHSSLNDKVNEADQMSKDRSEEKGEATVMENER